jgi:hypothetical protein
MKVLPVELRKATRRAGDNNGVGFSLESLLEISSTELGVIDSYRGDVCFLVLTETVIGNEIPDIDVDEIIANMPESEIYDDHKTHSQRLRNVLYVQYQQKLGRKPTNEEFADYYKRSMEAMINKIKATLESDL